METNTPNATPEPKKSSAGKALLVILVLAGLGFFGYNHFSGKCDSTCTAKDSTAVVAPVVAPVVADTTKKAVAVDTAKATTPAPAKTK